VGQYLGDGLLCFFGARRSRGNDAARAVSCALALQNSAAEYYFHVQERYELESFFVRIGISTGRVVVGTIGTDEKSETLAMGSTTNLAARLQGVCPPGGVVVDGETQLRARDEFNFVKQPPVTLKGFSEPVNHYIVTGEQHQATTHLTSSRIGDIAIPFVGRSELFGKLTNRLVTAEKRSASQPIMLYGDIGIGKSRLLQEVALSKAAKPFYVVRMVGHYERRGNPFSLIRDMLAAVCDLSGALTVRAVESRITQHTQEHWDGQNAEAAAAVLGYLAGYGFADSPYTQSLTRGVSAPTDDERPRWVQRWLRGLAGERPVLLLVDNLQWADPDSMQVLRYLATNDKRILIFAAARADFETEAEEMMAVVKHDQLMLSPLTEPQIRQILDAVLDYVDNVPEDLIELIVARAEGNPLFVEEFLRMLFDNGVFKFREDTTRWRVDSIQYHMMEDHLP
ncbi:MAG: AAA family ATPase, partial [Chloroflexota bacterium]